MDDLGGKPTIFGNSHIFFPRVFFNRPFQVSAVFQDGIGSEDAGKRTPASPDQRLGMLSRGGWFRKTTRNVSEKNEGIGCVKLQASSGMKLVWRCKMICVIRIVTCSSTWPQTSFSWGFEAVFFGGCFSLNLSPILSTSALPPSVWIHQAFAGH